MHKYIYIFVSFFVIFMFSGCGSLNLGSETNINENGSGSVTWKIAYDGIFRQVVGENGSILQENKLTWSYTLAQINPEEPLTATYEIINVLNIILLIVAIIALLLISLFIFFMQKKKIAGTQDTTKFNTMKSVENNNESTEEILNQEKK